jgi:endonuclease YncB( thermonuclease family)
MIPNILARAAIFVLMLLAAGIVCGQRRMAGQVVELVDGKTVVVAIPNGRITVQLQYIDVPEPGQELNQVVRDHLQFLVVGKPVEYRPLMLAGNRTVGQLFLRGVDVSQQMLRDGAAWLVPTAATGTQAPELESYSVAESQAKADKLGVWSIKGLKPAWEYRFDKNEARRAEEERLAQQYSVTAKPGPAIARETRSAAKPGINNAGGFINNYDAVTRTGKIETPVLPINDKEGLGRKVACSLAYVYQEEANNTQKGTFYYYVAFVDTPRLGDNLTVMVDGKKVAVAKGKLRKEAVGISTVESLVFEMSRSTVEKIANGGDVGLRLGNEVITPAPGFQMVIYNLLDASK